MSSSVISPFLTTFFLRRKKTPTLVPSGWLLTPPSHLPPRVGSTPSVPPPWPAPGHPPRAPQRGYPRGRSPRRSPRSQRRCRRRWPPRRKTHLKLGCFFGSKIWGTPCFWSAIPRKHHLRRFIWSFDCYSLNQTPVVTHWPSSWGGSFGAMSGISVLRWRSKCRKQKKCLDQNKQNCNEIQNGILWSMVHKIYSQASLFLFAILYWRMLWSC